MPLPQRLGGTGQSNSTQSCSRLQAACAAFLLSPGSAWAAPPGGCGWQTFLALLNPKRLQEVTLVLSDGEPLPVDALAVLAGCPQLRSLAIRSLNDWFHHGCGALAEQEAPAAACLRKLKQITSLSIQRDNVSRPVMEAVQCLPQLERLKIVANTAFQ